MSNAVSLSVGDVVQVKSGGPRMTITQITNGNAECTWFENGTPVPFSQSFPLAILAPPPSPVAISSEPRRGW